MARLSRARKIEREHPWPETVELMVVHGILERSGEAWFAVDHYVRKQNIIPNTIPTSGYSPHGKDANGRAVCSPARIKVHKEAVIVARVVDHPTGAPLEWSPREIWEACAARTVRLLRPDTPGLRELLEEGQRQKGTSEVRLIPPMSLQRNPLYDRAEPVSLTPDGILNQRQGEELTTAFPGIMPGWTPPSTAPVQPVDYPSRR